MSQRAPILVYHHVYPDGHPGLERTSRERATGVVSESDLRRHLSYLAEHGWEVVPTTRIVDWLEHGTPLPERALALHFDNGWLDCVTGAMPILREFGVTATAYVITDGTTAASEGRTAVVHTTTEGVTENPLITWEHAAKLVDAGWEIGAHTATHPRLADIHERDGDAPVLREVEESNQSYRRHLGFVPAHFAYPSGSRSQQTDELLSRHYRSLRLWEFSSPPVWRFTDGRTSPLALECQNIDNTVSFEDFARLFAEALSGC